MTLLLPLRTPGLLSSLLFELPNIGDYSVTKLTKLGTKYEPRVVTPLSDSGTQISFKLGVYRRRSIPSLEWSAGS